MPSSSFFTFKLFRHGTISNYTAHNTQYTALFALNTLHKSETPMVCKILCTTQYTYFYTNSKKVFSLPKLVKGCSYHQEDLLSIGYSVQFHLKCVMYKVQGTLHTEVCILGGSISLLSTNCQRTMSNNLLLFSQYHKAIFCIFGASVSALMNILYSAKDRQKYVEKMLPKITLYPNFCQGAVGTVQIYI